MRVIALIIFLSIECNAQLLVDVRSKDSKCKTMAEVFISQDRQLLYQITAPIQGDVEVKLKPGQYQLDVRNKESCSYSQAFSIEKSEVRLIAELKRGDRHPAFSEAAYSPSRGFGMGMMPFMPWWYPYTYSRFTNWGYPCFWSYWGCGGSMYPPGGPMVMGKPNIYIEGPDVEQAKIAFDPISFSKIIAAAPAHFEKGWTFSLKKNQIYKGATQFPYIFYDARITDAHVFNRTHGFCDSRKNVLDKMISILKESRFPKQAIADFTEYWTVKLPAVDEFCVYPQSNKELETAMKFNTTLNQAQWIRWAFVLVPYYGASKAPPQRYGLKWRPEPYVFKSLAANGRSPASAHTIYEWGVGFLFE